MELQFPKAACAHQQCAVGIAIMLLLFAPTLPMTSDAAELPARIENTTLQEGNTRPKRLIQLKRLTDLTGNRIGDLFPIDGQQPFPCPPREDWAFTHLAELGLTWAHLSIDRMEWESAAGAGVFSESSINECQNKIVSLLTRKGVTVVHMIVHWDRELHATRPPNYRNEEEIQLYLDYVRMIVQTFKDRVRYYEILNEAHVYVELDDYIELVRRAVEVIREEYPEARIMAGGASGLYHSEPREFLFGFLESDVMPLIDAVGIHPFFGESPQFDETREYYENYPALVQEIKDVAEAHGFTGEYIASSMDWRTEKNAFPDQPWVYPAKVAAKYYARAIVLHRGLDAWAGIGGEMYDLIVPIARAVRNLGTVLDGAEPEPLTVEFEGEATNILGYSFTLPNGNRLFALWTNGTAVKNDAGVAATLIFPEYTVEKAIAFDVLNGFRQRLDIQQDGANLVIHDLLVKDYPIFVRLHL